MTATAIGLNRMYVGAHFPLDVLGGIGVGMAPGRHRPRRAVLAGISLRYRPWTDLDGVAHRYFYCPVILSETLDFCTRCPVR